MSWIPHPDEPLEVVSAEEHNYEVCRLACDQRMYNDPVMQQRRALICAAPELLYACQSALEYLDKHQRGDDLITATTLQNAIAKAKQGLAGSA